MKKTLTLSAVFGIRLLFSQTGIPVPQMTASDNLINNFITKYSLPGGTVAITKDGKIVYLRAFGYQDIAKTIAAQPYNMFRIASLSKQVTAIAIMKMIENGQLTLASKVFGAGGILEHHPIFSTALITDSRIYNINIQNLLEHNAGWNRDINCNPNPTLPYPYFFSGCDPISFPLRVTQLTGTSNPVTKEALIKFLLQKGLDAAPGTVYNYSNIGFLILGEVIEKIAGIDYEAWVQQNILAPLGIFDMHIGKNLLSEKMEREVEYAGNGYTTLSIFNTGQYVPWEYGGFNVTAMDAHGGWIASARDMLKLLTAVDGFSTKPDLLLPATIATMVTPSTTNAYYAKGWSVNPFNNWWHTGSLDGTASEQVRSGTGYTWIFIFNKRINSNNFWADLDNLGWNCIAQTTTYPTWDLMATPTVNAASTSFSDVGSNTLTLHWNNGNGDNRIVVASEKNAVSTFPLDGTDYTASAVYGSGSVTGTGNYVVYNGTGNSVSVSGLTSGKTYYFRVMEYNKNLITGNNALYLLGNNAVNNLRVIPTYNFTGSGYWNTASNWENSLAPPSILPVGSQILVNPPTGGECVVNIYQTITAGASLIVTSGKKCE